jgi:hypothetical protein
VTDRLDVVAVEVDHVVVAVVARPKSGTLLSVPPAASAAAWKASTVALSEAAKARWSAAAGSPV